MATPTKRCADEARVDCKCLNVMHQVVKKKKKKQKKKLLGNSSLVKFSRKSSDVISCEEKSRPTSSREEVSCSASAKLELEQILSLKIPSLSMSKPK